MSSVSASILEHGLSSLSLSDRDTTSNIINAIDRATSGPPSASLALAGMEDVLETLRELISWPVIYAEQAAILGIHWPRGVLLHGPTGVGKSAAVAAIAAECGAAIHLITPAMIFGAYTGESERKLREAFAAAEADARDNGRPAVIFLDEVDALCPQRQAGQQHEARIVAQLLTLLDGAASGSQRTQSNTIPQKEQQKVAGHVVIVAASSRPNAIDAALRRPGRLDREVAVPIPSPEARGKILGLVAGAMPLAEDVDLNSIAAVCHGYTGADLVALCREAAMRTIIAATQPLLSSNTNNNNSQQQGEEGQGKPYSHQRRLEDIINAPPRPVSASDFEAARSKVGASIARGAAREFPPAHWDDIGGCQEAKRRLIQAVEWPLTRGDALKRLGLKPPRGVLLHGPPGCAKTTLARAAATASGATFIPLIGSELYSMWVGEGEAALREAFRRARLASPAIIFVDEIDAVVGKRPAGVGAAKDNDASARLLSTFLTEMDGMELATGVLVLATTNRPKALDPALLRPGRFDHVVFVPPPDAAGRLAALLVHTKAMPLAPDVDLESIAARTELYTGAELAGVCREAALAALREGGVSMHSVEEVAGRHFEAAVRAVRPALSEELLAQYADWPPKKV